MADDMPRALTDELVAAFVRLAKGDFAVRLERNYKRDNEDALAFFVNLIGEQLARLTAEREEQLHSLERAVTGLSELFLRLAAGDFDVRAERSERGDALDVLAFMFNNTASEIGAAVAELDRQRRVVEAILESMVDGVLLLDAQLHISRCNPAMAELLGRGVEELHGQSLARMLEPRERGLAGELRQLATQRAITNRAARFVHAEGTSVELNVSASAQRDDDGGLAGIVLLARDDRELKQVQAQLQMSDRLATMGTVAAGVAHEINNPLAFVLANIDFIGEELEELATDGSLEKDRVEEVVRAIAATKGGVERVRQIVRDLKSFSRADEDVVGPVDLNRVIDAAMGFMRSEARHHAQLVKEYGVVPVIHANEGRMVQVFLNLLQNAVQAIPMGDAQSNTIRIVTGTHASGLAMAEVGDTGQGIDPEDLARIFDMFYTTKPRGVGTGLGLSIVHRIVEAAGGRVEVESEVGRGSVFRVLLPAAVGKDTTPSAITHRSIPPPPRRMRVLVVDDEQEIGQAVVRILGNQHDVDVVTRGSAALSLLDAHHYDVILCDLLMPEMTGIQLYQKLCESNEDVANRFVFMTGASSHPDAREFLARIDNPRIDKPFDATSLRALLSGN